MSALAPTFFNQPKVLGRGSRASSQISQTVREQFEDAKRHARSAASALHSQAYAALAAIAKTCERSNWDGYEAKPISRATEVRVRAFLDDLPSTLPAPDIVPEADGEIAIEWYLGPDKVFSLSIGESELVHFAGQFGNGVERHGVEPFDGVVSADILALIHKLLSGADHASRPRRAA